MAFVGTIPRSYEEAMRDYSKITLIPRDVLFSNSRPPREEAAIYKLLLDKGWTAEEVGDLYKPRKGNTPLKTMQKTYGAFALSPPPKAARSFPDTTKTRVRDKYAYKEMIKNDYKVARFKKGGNEHNEHIGEGETSILVDKAGGIGGKLTFDEACDAYSRFSLLHPNGTRTTVDCDGNRFKASILFSADTMNPGVALTAAVPR